jgi:hypothetical protein
MKERIVLLAALLLLAGAASAQELVQTAKQSWTTGWDNFGEPLDLTHSSVSWSVSTALAAVTVSR